MIWGWGRKSVTRQIAEDRAVVLAYRYFHLMFVLTATWGGKYFVSTLTDQGWAQQPASDDAALALLGGNPLRPSAWARFSLLGALAILAVFVVASAVVTP